MSRGRRRGSALLGLLAVRDPRAIDPSRVGLTRDLLGDRQRRQVDRIRVELGGRVMVGGDHNPQAQLADLDAAAGERPSRERVQVQDRLGGPFHVIRQMRACTVPRSSHVRNLRTPVLYLYGGRPVRGGHLTCRGPAVPDRLRSASIGLAARSSAASRSALATPRVPRRCSGGEPPRGCGGFVAQVAFGI